MVLRRKALGEEALRVHRGALRRGGRSPAARAVREWTALQQRLASGRLAASDADAERPALREMEARARRLEAAVAERLPAMRLGSALRALDARAVRSALPSDAALVEIVRYSPLDFAAIAEGRPLGWLPARYGAFVVRGGAGGGVRAVDLGEAAEAERELAAFRASMPAAGRHLRPASTADAASPDTGAWARRLYTRLYAPYAARLDGCRRVLIAPDGALARLPFAVLSPAPGRCLADDHRIAYVGCGRDLLRARDPASADPPGPPLVVADPDFDLADPPPALRADAKRRTRGRRSGVPRFERLRGAAREGERVAELLGVHPLCGAEALESRIKGCRSPRILHLATHGFYLGDAGGADGHGSRLGRLAGTDDPMLRSALALAGANRWLRGEPLPAAAEDGLLTAREVLALDLAGTELVVLSACETGLGETRAGDGVAGLRRAFAAAGARTLVMSLWRVPDEETRRLMERFYAALVEGAAPAEALHQAQAALRAEGARPYAWGAFICQGPPDWRTRECVDEAFGRGASVRRT